MNGSLLILFFLEMRKVNICQSFFWLPVFTFYFFVTPSSVRKLEQISLHTMHIVIGREDEWRYLRKPEFRKGIYDFFVEGSTSLKGHSILGCHVYSGN